MKLEDLLKPEEGTSKERWTGPFFDVVVTKLGATELYSGKFYVYTNVWGNFTGQWNLQHMAGPLPREEVLLELEKAMGQYSPVLKQELQVEPKSALARLSDEDPLL